MVVWQSNAMRGTFKSSPKIVSKSQHDLRRLVLPMSGDIGNIFMMVGGSPPSNQSASCIIQYNPQTGMVYLYNDAGNAIVAPGVPASIGHACQFAMFIEHF